MRTIILVLLILICVGCSDSGIRFRSACGIVFEGQSINSLKENSATRVRITGYFQGNVLTLRDTGNNDLYTVVLHGLAPITDQAQREAAEEFVADYIGEEAYFFAASRNCRVTSGDFNRLIPGQIFVNATMSLSEELLLRGLAEVEGRNQCGSRLIDGCQTGLLLEGALSAEE